MAEVKVLDIISSNGFSIKESSKYIVLYFTAHWCPPCRNFSPQFIESMKVAGDDVDVFICSRDNQKPQYDEYMAKFEGFNILPFQSNDTSSLMSKFQINGIPSVQVLDKNGELVTDEGRSVIMSSKNNFVEGVAKILNQQKRSGLDILKEDIQFQFPEQAKYIGIYFTASWCPPCKSFSPTLIQTLKDINQSNPGILQLVIASCDEEDSFEECVEKYKSIDNTHIIKHGDENLQNLAQKYQVKTIPNLIILSASTGQIVSKNGREQIEQHKSNVLSQWN